MTVNYSRLSSEQKDEIIQSLLNHLNLEIKDVANYGAPICELRETEIETELAKRLTKLESRVEAILEAVNRNTGRRGYE